MIPRVDLKKGNYFYPQNLRDLLRVDVINSTGIISMNQTNFPAAPFNFESIFPVILTPKILAATPFKFVRHDAFGRWKTYQHDDLIIHLSEPGFHVNHGNKFIIYDALHQLQNIYMSVTKKELPIFF